MSRLKLFVPSDWGAIRLVVFDVDGTLYRQRQLRLQMARDLILHTLHSRDLGTISVLMKYRRIREKLGRCRVTNFLQTLVSETAIAADCPAEQVAAIVREWIEKRPLPYLLDCRYPGVAELFSALRGKGKSIGIFSDYAATDKLEALQLFADYIVSAEDEGINALKPDPKGLEALMDSALAEPSATVLIGDRPDRDGLAARQVGAWALLRSSRPVQGWQTFAAFNDPLFSPLLA